ncbi:uncharacterized protein LOC109535111 [Dendroctonus ponderosae]|uniref:Osiris 11 n=1 Tax=Dendroctonus ponderosae TaxID=77166 RepID=U4TXI5_DENPD|nr:uncharacterized protein LOC109535111 [Dendroctonus ponderosae]ERL86314.1 hypothetical protein D910_03722 [Dendroctonus ponderosae]KAH1017389.1 hypothetical protein HUJ05_008034 [Dendroctonus ponderosae]
MNNSLPLIVIIICMCADLCKCHSTETGMNNASQILQKFLSSCSHKKQFGKCLKIQALKVTERALNLKALNVMDGVKIVGNNRLGKSISQSNLNETKLEMLTHSDLDDLLGDRTSRFFNTHKIEVNIPKLIEQTGRSWSGQARGKGGGSDGKDKGGGNGALLAALAIKGSFLAMAYQGIAVMSGTAIIIGKMALVLTAILGLKKLVSGNQEKTTFEIIKTPKYTEEHVHTSTYEDDYHDNYRRNYLDNGEIQKRIFRFRLPPH